MTFLTPWSALAAAAVSITALLLLYVLKLRRRMLRWSSTLFWTRFAEDLEVNTPFQRLRMTPLLLIQLLILLLLLLALGQPVLERPAPIAARAVLLIDQSASMSALDAGDEPPTTRLDRAKALAIELIDGKPRDGEVLVIAFGARPEIISGFEQNASQLRAAVESIEPTDEEADLDAALELAASMATRSAGAGDAAADVVLVSDGGVAGADGSFTLRTGRFRQVAVGEAAPNTGVTQFSARRDPVDPMRVIVFAELACTGPEEVTTLLTLSVDDEPVTSRRVRIAAPDVGAPPGTARETFELDVPGAAVLRVDHTTRDALPADDLAVAWLPAPARPRVALVAPGDVHPALLELVRESEPALLRVLDDQQYELTQETPGELARRFDLVVFDRFAPAALPELPTLSFGAAPLPFASIEPSDPGGRRILSWARRHPLLRHASLDGVVFAGGALRLPAEATPLAYGPDGPVMATLGLDGVEHAVVAFDLARSNWSTDLSVAIFMQNAMDLLWQDRGGRTARVDRPGTSLALRARAGAREITVRGPETFVRPVVAGLTPLPPLRRAGLYRVEGVAAEPTHLAISMLSAVETDLRPRGDLDVTAVAEGPGPSDMARREPLWPWLIAASMALLVVEWLLYCRRVRG